MTENIFLVPVCRWKNVNFSSYIWRGMNTKIKLVYYELYEKRGFIIITSIFFFFFKYLYCDENFLFPTTTTTTTVVYIRRKRAPGVFALPWCIRRRKPYIRGCPAVINEKIVVYTYRAVLYYLTCVVVVYIYIRGSLTGC